MPEIEIRDDGPLERIGRRARERLEIAFPPAKFQHAYMPSRVTPQIWGELLRRTPFIGLGWAQLGPKPGTPAGEFIGAAAWAVYLVVRNPAGQAARLFGDRQGPGVFKMTRAAIAMLHGAPVPEVGTIQVLSAGHGFMDGYEKDDVSMAVVDFGCPANISVCNTLHLEVPDLSEIDITWSFAGDPAGGLTDDITTGAS